MGMVASLGLCQGLSCQQNRELLDRLDPLQLRWLPLESALQNLMSPFVDGGALYYGSARRITVIHFWRASLGGRRSKRHVTRHRLPHRHTCEAAQFGWIFQELRKFSVAARRSELLKSLGVGLKNSSAVISLLATALMIAYLHERTGSM
jgi:hypothetical protein